MSQIPDELDQVGEGWHLILMNLHEKLLPLCPAYVVGQVKEKYGTLRVYLDQPVLPDYDMPPYPKQVWDEVARAEVASRTVCEYCGKPGEASTKHWWVKTVCQEHDL